MKTQKLLVKFASETLQSRISLRMVIIAAKTERLCILLWRTCIPTSRVQTKIRKWTLFVTGWYAIKISIRSICPRWYNPTRRFWLLFSRAMTYPSEFSQFEILKPLKAQIMNVYTWLMEAGNLLIPLLTAVRLCLYRSIRSQSCMLLWNRSQTTCSKKYAALPCRTCKTNFISMSPINVFLSYTVKAISVRKASKWRFLSRFSTNYSVSQLLKRILHKASST